jgi:hypothetical protein
LSIFKLSFFWSVSLCDIILLYCDYFYIYSIFLAPIKKGHPEEEKQILILLFKNQPWDNPKLTDSSRLYTKNNNKWFVRSKNADFIIRKAMVLRIAMS